MAATFQPMKLLTVHMLTASNKASCPKRANSTWRSAGKRWWVYGGLKCRIGTRTVIFNPKTDIDTENRPCQQKINLSTTTIYFGGYVSFREAKTLMESFIFWGGDKGEVGEEKGIRIDMELVEPSR